MDGQVFLFLANDGGGRRTMPRQMRVNSDQLIQHLCRSDLDSQFRIRAFLSSIFGRTHLMMESEVKPLGIPFDGNGTTIGFPADTGVDGEVLWNHYETDLMYDTQYHWRARAKYDLARNPFQQNGPWLQVPVGGWNEASLRTRPSSLVGVDELAGPVSASGFALSNFGAHPRVGSCEVLLSLGQQSRLDVTILDVQGRTVAELTKDDVRDAGNHVLRWDGRDRTGMAVSAGVYFVRVLTAEETLVRKVVLLR
jgi:hypothetical protein